MSRYLRAGAAGVVAGFLVVAIFAVWASRTAEAGGIDEFDGSLKDGGFMPSFTTWGGCYLGIQAGFLSDDSTVTGIPAAVTTGDTLTNDGATGGAFIGCNRQEGSLVYGLEAEINAADDSDAYGSVGVRIGYAIGTTLLYGRVGVAFSQQQFNIANGGAVVQVDETVGGVAYGVGMEQVIQAGVRLRLDVTRYDYNERLHRTAIGSANVDQANVAVRVGLSFRFSSRNGFPGADPDVVQP